jgi:hypothetical protein
MNFFKKREVSVILAEHDAFSNNAFLPKVPSYAEYILHNLPGTSIAEDFQIADKEFIINENEKISSISDNFISQWLVFALSGQGDYWLLNNIQNTVGFYDHNKEDFSISNVQKIEITLEDWIVLGDLFHQYDLLNEFNPGAFNDNYTLKQECRIYFIEEVNSIKKGLFDKIPFSAM